MTRNKAMPSHVFSVLEIFMEIRIGCR
jgi:hypothetical protein